MLPEQAIAHEAADDERAAAVVADEAREIGRLLNEIRAHNLIVAYPSGTPQPTTAPRGGVTS